MASSKRCPAVKRIAQEIREMEEVCKTSTEFQAQALEDDIFEWHFIIAGPRDTDFEGGLFHGRILLPAEYPFAPPSFVMLTPTGRFETNTKICLSISSFHPEHWQPSWSVRTALTALIAFFPSDGRGAVGSLDLPAANRRSLAAKSRSEIPPISSDTRRSVMQQLHQHMLAVESLGGLGSAASSTAQPPDLGDGTASTAAAARTAHTASNPTGVPASAGPNSAAAEPAGIDAVPTTPAAADFSARSTEASRQAAASGRPPRYEHLIDTILFWMVSLIVLLCCRIAYTGL